MEPIPAHTEGLPLASLPSQAYLPWPARSDFRRSRTASVLTARRHQAGAPHPARRACPARQPSPSRPREPRCRW